MRPLLMLLLLALGCPPHPKPTTFDMAGPQTILGIPLCDPAVVVHTAEVCDSYFVQRQVPCAQCAAAAGCIAKRATVYCAATGGCGADPLCVFEPGP